jgi:hypothetical protein
VAWDAPNALRLRLDVLVVWFRVFMVGKAVASWGLLASGLLGF